MLQVLLTKLRQSGPVSAEDGQALQAAFSNAVSFQRGENVLLEGDLPKVVTTLLEGIVCRYKLLSNGKRQITAVMVPGDMCDLSSILFGSMDYGIVALANSRIATADRQKVLDLVAIRPNLARALWWSTLVDEAVLREWAVGLGRRTAHQRVAHLFCELLLRHQAVGLASDNSCPLPLTQESLADAVGLTVVHVNRIVQDFRSAGMINWQGKLLTIHRWQELCAIGEFTPGYLHQRNIAAI